jgi:hypothetical protein
VRAEAQVASLCGALGLALLLGACEGPSSTPAASGSAAPPSADAADPLAPLRAHEATLRGGIDFTHRPPWDHATGPNPSALAPLPSGKGFVGLLRGADALVLLGPDGKERRRYPAPPSPTALAVGPDGAIFVGGQASGRIQRFREVADELSLEGELTLPEALSVRTLAVGPKGTLYVADFEGGRVLAVAPETRATEGRLGAKPLGERRCHGPLRLAVAERRLLVDCLLDHAVVVVNLGEDGALQKGGEAEIRHDGPLWSMAVAPTKDGLLVALGGIEDQPLDRSQGAFGFIDSFLFLYLVRGDDADLVRLANLSQLDVVTPKWLDLEVSPAEVSVAVTGYGGETMVTLHYPPEVHGALRVDKRTLPPGTVAAARLPGGERLFANALLDAWVSEADSALTPVEPAQGAPQRTPTAWLGEALLFTTLMAPFNKTDGQRSKFTCEACHFEGYVDGRTHSTGRGNVRATTKPLVGLGNNRPYFSRALDPDLSSIAENEFDVAGRKSGADPHFTLTLEDHPWLRQLGLSGPQEPLALRKALMEFLVGFAPRPNPRAQGRTAFTDEERKGAEAFRALCEGCHSARTVADEPTSLVPFERWEAMIFSPEGPIVWGQDRYADTGIRPSVHELGARIPSLRRLERKWPYFTNGSARSLAELLAGVRTGGETTLHASAEDPTQRALSADELRALGAFLLLL